MKKMANLVMLFFAAFFLSACGSGDGDGGSVSNSPAVTSTPGTFIEFSPIDGDSYWMIVRNLDKIFGPTDWKQAMAGENEFRLTDSIGILPQTFTMENVGGPTTYRAKVMVADYEVVQLKIRAVNPSTGMEVSPLLDITDTSLAPWICITPEGFKRLAFRFERGKGAVPLTGGFARSLLINYNSTTGLSLKTYLLAGVANPADIVKATYMHWDNSGFSETDINTNFMLGWTTVGPLSEGLNLVNLKVDLVGGDSSFAEWWKLWNEKNPYIVELVRSDGSLEKWLCIIRSLEIIRSPISSDKPWILSVAGTDYIRANLSTE